MVNYNEGINRIRDLVFDDISDGQLGTGTSAKNESDDALETPVASTLKTLTLKSKSEKSIKFDYELLSTEGTTSNFTEFSINKITSPITTYSGDLFTSISFITGGTKDLIFSKVQNFRGQ